MFANLRNDVLRQVRHLGFDVGPAVVPTEWIAQKASDHSVDQCIALLRGHEVLKRDGTMLTVEYRRTEETIEIGRNEERVVDEIDNVKGARGDMGRDRKTADRVPELGWALTCSLKVIEQNVLELVGRREPAPTVLRSHAGSNVDPSQTGRLLVSFNRWQLAKIAPGRHQRSAGRGEGLTEGRIWRERQLHGIEMETSALHFNRWPMLYFRPSSSRVRTSSLGNAPRARQADRHRMSRSHASAQSR